MKSQCYLSFWQWESGPKTQIKQFGFKTKKLKTQQSVTTQPFHTSGGWCASAEKMGDA